MPGHGGHGHSGLDVGGRGEPASGVYRHGSAAVAPVVPGGGAAADVAVPPNTDDLDLTFVVTLTYEPPAKDAVSGAYETGGRTVGMPAATPQRQ